MLPLACGRLQKGRVFHGEQEFCGLILHFSNLYNASLSYQHCYGPYDQQHQRFSYLNRLPLLRKYACMVGYLGILHQLDRSNILEIYNTLVMTASKFLSPG